MLVGILRFFIIFILLLDFGNCAYLGGTISWYHYNGKFRFVYRMTWEKGSGPCGTGCSLADIGSLGTLPQTLVTLSWNCTKGCENSTELHDVNYYITTTSHSTHGYEQGENFFFTLLGAITGPYQVTLDGLQWGKGFPGVGRMMTTINVARRNDTNLPNASPIAASPPYLGFQFGCVSEFKLPVEDPDEDTMRCRFSTASECGTGCTTNLKGLTINTEKCTMKIHATSANGYLPNTYYRVAITVEDFSDYTVKVGGKLHTNEEPFSSIPLQFTFRIVKTTEPCGTNSVQITSPTTHGFRVPYPGKPFVYSHAVFVKSQNISSTYFVVSNPAKFKYQQLSDDKNRSDVTKLHGTWRDVDGDQYADSLACSWALNNINGLTSAQKCFVPMVYDMNQCITYQCKMNGTCIDLWHRATCRCPYGYKRPDCSKKITCADSPCRNRQSCVESEGTYKCYTSVRAHSALPTVAIVTGTTAALVTVVATAFGLWYYWKKKKEKRITPDVKEEVVKKVTPEIEKGSLPVSDQQEAKTKTLTENGDTIKVVSDKTSPLF